MQGAKLLIFKSISRCRMGLKRFLEAQTANTQIHRKIGDSLKKKNSQFNGGKSDEGAWIANIDTVDAFEVIAKACEEVGNEVGF